MAPKLNTTADGALYLTVLDLARWAVGLNHLRYPGPDGLRQSWTPVRLNDGGTYPYGFGWSLDQQRGFPRIGHTGSWQGFKASIQRYPEQDLTVIAMANLAEARPEAITLAVAGILEPALRPPQVIPEPAAGAPPPQPISDLLQDISSAASAARLTPGLARFLSGEFRDVARRAAASEPAMVVEGLRRCLRPAPGAARLGHSADLLRRRPREGRRVAGGGGLLRPTAGRRSWTGTTSRERREPEHGGHVPAPDRLG